MQRITDRQTRTVIVMGASRGVSEAIAKCLVREDVAVMVNYSGNAAPAQVLIATINGAAGRRDG